MPAVGTRRKGSMVAWNINIPAELAVRFETLYMDTGKHKPVYGKKSEVISALLRSHISEIEQQLAKGGPA